jgi:NTE family protein
MADWKDFLATIPLFSFLGEAELEKVHSLFVESSHQKGDVICRAGDEGDKFYVIRSGELEVWAGPEGEQRQTGTLKRGDYFGEMALLQGGKRTATVIVKRRAKLLSLDKASFNSLFLNEPKTLEHFTRVLCQRLASVSKGVAVVGGTMTVAITGKKGLKGKSIISAGLAGILRDLTGSEVLLVRVWPGKVAPQGSLEQLLSDELDLANDNVNPAIRPLSDGISVLDVPARVDQTAQFYSERSSNLISRVSGRFRFILYDLGSEPQALVDSARDFADAIIEVVEKPEDLASHNGTPGTKKLQVINLYNAGSYPIPINQCEPFVIPRDPALTEGDTTQYLRSNRHGPSALPLHRLARKLMNATVGLALGGGAAFGVSHLGVLKVLEDNGIPIDVLAGCSQGSIIGVGYAAGIKVDDMIASARHLGQKRNLLLPFDPTLSKPGILAGSKFIDIFSPMLHGKEVFEDLVLPCRTVATDIESGERVEIGTGKLTDAFRASASVPMVFSPWKLGDRVLVDGGVADPVPAEVVSNMGADLCIAVNVVPPLKKGLENEVSKAYRILNRFNPLSYIGDSRNLPNLFDIIMNSMQILQYELGNFKAIRADVLINPDLSDFTWIEYYRSEELIQRGIEAAERALPAIQRAYAQKLAPFQPQNQSAEDAD